MSSTDRQAGGGYRILCVVAWWPDSNYFNGIFIKEHVKAIALFHDVEVIHLRYARKSFSLPAIRTNTTIEDGIPVHRVDISTPVRRFGYLEHLIQKAYARVIGGAMAGRPFHILHVHVLDHVTAHVSAQAEKWKLPMVLTEHFTFYHSGILKLPPAEQKQRREGIRRWFSNERLRSIMPVSHDLANVMIRDFEAPPEKMDVIPNIAADDFGPSGPRAATPPFNILLAAIWRQPKDHDVFIKALRSLPGALLEQCRIEWAGDGPDMELIRSRCRNELPGVKFNFPGHVDKPRLAEMMRRAHLFVLPTKAENLPCVLLESLCTGTPVLSMAVNGIPELVDDTNGIMVPPSDPEALAAALAMIITGKVKFDHAAIARAALARFNKHAVAKRISDAYDKIMEEQTARKH
jgi:glycosyltransferase involved in cell wall biosynthesis